MSADFAPELATFRAEAAAWLSSQLEGPFNDLKGQVNQVDKVERRRQWEETLGAAGWSVIGWPTEHGGRGASVSEQVVFAEEYARAKGPPRVGHLGVELLGPTLIALGDDAQQQRFLPAIRRGEAIWCQGYSEPGAGSDLAAVQTKARREGDRYVIDGQKIWTSMGAIADWCFVLARTEPGSIGPRGLSFLLTRLDQPGIEVRPIRQMTGDSEFAEVFFDGAVALEADRIGADGEGWAVAMALLGYERGVSTLAQQMHFQTELDQIVAAAKSNGRSRDALIRQKVAQAHAGLRIMRFNALRMLEGRDSAHLSGAAYTYKLYWSSWRRDLGELAMDVLGQDGELASPDGGFDGLTNMFLMSRADTLYAGASEIQKNIIAERGLGLPREPRG
ncbi:Acryloyl-CoA reductase (NADH) [compost metagenome]